MVPPIYFEVLSLARKSNLNRVAETWRTVPKFKKKLLAKYAIASLIMLKEFYVNFVNNAIHVLVFTNNFKAMEYAFIPIPSSITLSTGTETFSFFDFKQYITISPVRIGFLKIIVRHNFISKASSFKWATNFDRSSNWKTNFHWTHICSLPSMPLLWVCYAQRSVSNLFHCVNNFFRIFRILELNFER